MPKWSSATIIKIEEASPTTRRFWLKVDPEISKNFRPGQFITLDLPIHEKRQKRWRSYSIANSPNDEGLLELVIVLLEDGAGTTYLFEQAKVGTEISYKGPLGVFTLPKELPQELVFLCTGTGIAPFRSMLQHIIAEGSHFPPAHLIFGTRYATGILYREEWEKMAQEKEQFTFSAALSREDHPYFPKGYIHSIYHQEYKEVNPDRHFYICGWSQMVDEAVANLKSLGYEERQIHFELYG